MIKWVAKVICESEWKNASVLIVCRGTMSSLYNVMSDIRRHR